MWLCTRGTFGCESGGETGVSRSRVLLMIVVVQQGGVVSMELQCSGLLT